MSWKTLTKCQCWGFDYITSIHLLFTLGNQISLPVPGWTVIGAKRCSQGLSGLWLAIGGCGFSPGETAVKHKTMVTLLPTPMCQLDGDTVGPLAAWSSSMCDIRNPIGKHPRIGSDIRDAPIALSHCWYWFWVCRCCPAPRADPLLWLSGLDFKTIRFESLDKTDWDRTHFTPWEKG